MGGSPPSQGVGWILGSSPDANGAMVHAAAERHRRHPKVCTWQVASAANSSSIGCRCQNARWLLAVDRYVVSALDNVKRSGWNACLHYRRR